MANRRFQVYEIRQVLVQMRGGASDRVVAQSGLVGRKKSAWIRQIAGEKGWLNPANVLPDDPVLALALDPPRERPEVASSVATWEKEILSWAQEGIRWTTIHKTLCRRYGYEGSYSAVRRFLQTRIQKDPASLATVMLDFSPGEAAQVDFGTGPPLLDPVSGNLAKTWIFVMTLCHSRHQYAEIVFDQSVRTWCGLHRRAFEWFWGVPKKMILDNLKAGIVRACYYDPEAQRSYAGLAEGYGFMISPCPVADPEKKGRVEAGVKYVKNAFFPLRTFANINVANKELESWVTGEAGNRIHGTTRKRPLDLFGSVEKNFLGPLPDRPVEIVVWEKHKVQNTGHITFEKNSYSVPYFHIKKDVWVKAGDTLLWIYDQKTSLIATHPRLKGAGRRNTVEAHMPPNAQAYFMKDPVWCREKAGRIGPACREVVEQLFADTVMDNLRKVQGILGLAERNTPPRLEEACKRALVFGNIHYRTIKSILDKGLDIVSEETAREQLPSIYTQGKNRFAPPSSAHPSLPRQERSL